MKEGGVMADLRDYLYVDEPRLDTYVKHFSSTTVFEKVPIWKVVFKLTGPSVEGTQERPARQLSVGEKVELLLDYLKKEKLVDHGRIGRDTYSFSQNERVFRLETCQVVSVIVPPNESATPPFKGLKMWVSERDERGEPNLLILLGDFNRDDEPSFYTMSRYSALLALADEGYGLKQAYESAGVGPFADLRREKDELVREEAEAKIREARDLAGAKYGRRNFEDFVPTAGFSTERKRLLEAESRLSEENLREEFSKHPVELLKRLAARTGARQRVETLYRVRSAMYDIAGPDSIVTIGYPIFISSAGVTY
jgi:hypothetical protein